MKRYKKIGKELLSVYYKYKRNEIKDNTFFARMKKIIEKYEGNNSIYAPEDLFISYPEKVEVVYHTEDIIDFNFKHTGYSESQYTSLLKRLNWLNKEIKDEEI